MTLARAVVCLRDIPLESIASMMVKPLDGKYRHIVDTREIELIYSQHQLAHMVPGSTDHQWRSDRPRGLACLIVGVRS